MLSIPFQNYNKIGGPFSFMTNLKAYLDKINFTYSTDLNNVENIFFPVEYNINVLQKVKKKRGKIIQRLDGVFYEMIHSKEQLEFNEHIKNIYLNYSDYVIFQSDYSKAQCFDMYGKKNESEYSIIINGVDKKMFFPQRKTIQTSEEISFVVTGNFRREEMLKPIIMALDEIYNDLRFKLNVVGPVIDELKPYLERNYINYHESKTLKQVAKILRQSDIFLFSFLNPACPNSVIEAISTGLPVVGFNSGSMSELLKFNNELLAYVSEDLFQKPEDFDYLKLKDKIAQCVQNFDKYRKIALDNSHLYSFEECGARYVEVFNDMIREQDTLFRKIVNIFK